MTTSETVQEKEKLGEKFFKWIHCEEGNNPVGCFIRKCLDASVASKLMGILVVSLVGFGLIFFQHTFTLHKMEGITNEIKMHSMPQYKVSQSVLRRLNGFKVSLLYILNHQPGESIATINDDVLANHQRLDDMQRMFATLKTGGTIHDVTNISDQTLDIFNVEPIKPASPIYNLVDDILVEFSRLDNSFGMLVDSLHEPVRQEVLGNLVDSLDEVYELVTKLAIDVNNQHNSSLTESGHIIERSQSFSFFISFAVALILIIATVLYILLIVSPLKDVLGKIKDITKDEGDLSKRIDVKTQDEVGQIAHQLNGLVENIFTLNSFKEMIEEDETTLEVHHRLAHLLQERYNFDKFFIYEAVGNKNEMNVAFASDHRYICNTETIGDCNLCRAKRTGHFISSIQFPDICPMFPFAGKMEHHCIPMIAGGRVIAIAQFLHDKEESLMSREDFVTNVKKASRYIKEATPVIEAKRFAAALKETTLKDPLTNLYNRRFLESYVDTLVANTLRRATRIGVMMCDMDFFKEINDTYGHEVGDAVIVKTAEILTSCVRTADMVIRYGGEEFLVLLTDVKDRNAVEDLAQRIRATMEATTIQIDGDTLQKTMSIGYSMFPTDTEGFWEAIKFADVALYKAKETGRNKVIGFTKDMWTQDAY